MRVPSIYHLVRGERSAEVLPPHDVSRRQQAAARNLLSDTRVSDITKNEHGQHQSAIFENMSWVTLSRTNRPVQSIMNVGLEAPTPNYPEAVDEVMRVFRRYVRPSLMDKCKIKVHMGTITEFIDEGQPIKNAKYWGPDWNSSATTAPVAIGARGNSPGGMDEDTHDLQAAMVPDFAAGRSDRPSTKNRISLYTNVMFRVFHMAGDPSSELLGWPLNHPGQSACTRPIAKTSCAFLTACRRPWGGKDT
jgi:hypothetical protein